MTAAADPPPPWYALTPPLWYARLPCPHCGDVRRFETRAAEPGDNGRAWYCPRCRAVLGVVVVTPAEHTMVRLAVMTGNGVTA